MRTGTSTRSTSRKRRIRRTLPVLGSFTLALMAAILGSIPSVPSAPADAAPAALPAAKTFVYTGGEQTYTVPPGVTLVTVRAVGAFGGPVLFQAGDGEDLTAYLPVTPNENLYTEVGQIGSVGGGAGFGGGGAAGTADGNSGGGATDVRTCSELAATCPGGGTSAASRLIVAGGGGGQGGDSPAQYDACGGGDGAGGANTAGPAQILTTPAGSFILARPANPTFAPSTPAGGGTNLAPGVGGFTGSCTFHGDTYSGSAAGTSGNGPIGGSGGSAPPFAGGGSGGGGGYFGGGGGASGNEICNTSSCFSGSNGAGGGGGSSFVSSVAVIGSAIGIGGAIGPPMVFYTPEVEIDTPASAATYSQGQLIHASFMCDSAVVSGCTGTVPSGQPFNTSTAGRHTFVVQGTIGGQAVKGMVTYTVVPTPTVKVTRPSGPFQLPASVTATYAGTGAHSAIVSYDVRYRVAAWNGGFGGYVYPSGWQKTRHPSETLSGSPGHEYCFSVRARDTAGSVSRWSPNHCTERPLDDRALSAITPGWTRGTGSAYYLGTYTETIGHKISSGG